MRWSRDGLRSHAEEMLLRLALAKDFADYYEENRDRLMDEYQKAVFWDKVYSNLDKEFLHENNYVTDGDTPFQVDVIEEDLNRYAHLC